MRARIDILNLGGDALENVKIKIEGMHCASCEMLIEMTLGDIEGVQSVDVSYPDGTATVIFDAEKTSETKLISALLELGYKINEVEED